MTALFLSVLCIFFSGCDSATTEASGEKVPDSYVQRENQTYDSMESVDQGESDENPGSSSAAAAADPTEKEDVSSCYDAAFKESSVEITTETIVNYCTGLDLYFHRPDCPEFLKGNDFLQAALICAYEDGYTPCPVCFKGLRMEDIL